MDYFILEKAETDTVWLDGRNGKWRPAKIQETGKRTATVSCPDCGRAASLSGHDVAEDGTVSPSLGCPYKDCEFHRYVKLEGWAP